MVNTVWVILIIIGVIYAVITKQDLTTTILNSPKESFQMAIEMLPILALWLGIMNIAQKAGLINSIAKIITKPLKLIFKEIPDNHESLGYISSNVAINMLGLGNAATPVGLKAMKSLKELNKSDKASKSMITFLVLNTSGLTIIPTTVIALRMFYNSSDPTKIIIPCILSTAISTIISLIIDKIFRRCTRD